jgi:hypothetical protein
MKGRGPQSLSSRPGSVFQSHAPQYRWAMDGGGTVKRKWHLPIQSGFARTIEDGSVNPLRAGQSHIARKAGSDSTPASSVIDHALSGGSAASFAMPPAPHRVFVADTQDDPCPRPVPNARGVCCIGRISRFTSTSSTTPPTATSTSHWAAGSFRPRRLRWADVASRLSVFRLGNTRMVAGPGALLIPHGIESVTSTSE